MKKDNIKTLTVDENFQWLEEKQEQFFEDCKGKFITRCQSKRSRSFDSQYFKYFCNSISVHNLLFKDQNL